MPMLAKPPGVNWIGLLAAVAFQRLNLAPRMLLLTYLVKILWTLWMQRADLTCLGAHVGPVRHIEEISARSKWNEERTWID